MSTRSHLDLLIDLLISYTYYFTDRIITVKEKIYLVIFPRGIVGYINSVIIDTYRNIAHFNKKSFFAEAVFMKNSPPT